MNHPTLARGAIVDIDGTLVDSNYQHTLAWDRALREHGAFVALWRIHRRIGTGGDQIVAALAGDEVEERSGDAIREAEGARYRELIDEVRVLDGARELLQELRRRGLTTVLASSAKAEEVDRYVDMLGARDLVHGWTTAADVDESKPRPDLVRAALRMAGLEANDAVLVGDTVWDVEAASRAGVAAVGVLTGGFGEAELHSAGAIAVYESVVDLRQDLDNTPLGRTVSRP